jgi:hypothetical protein
MRSTDNVSVVAGSICSTARVWFKKLGMRMVGYKSTTFGMLFCFCCRERQRSESVMLGVFIVVSYLLHSLLIRWFLICLSIILSS